MLKRFRKQGCDVHSNDDDAVPSLLLSFTSTVLDQRGGTRPYMI